MTATPFPIAPNWSTPYQVTREFRTTVQVSRSGKEQRRALRVTPRKKFQFSILATGAAATTFSRWQTYNAGYTVDLGDDSQAEAFTAPLAIGGNAVVLPEALSWAIAGVEVLLRQGNQSEVQTIEVVSGTTVTFSGTTAFNWNTSARLLPLLAGRIDTTGLQLTLASDAVLSGTVNFSVLPASEVSYAPPVAPATFNGRELFLTRPNWINSPQVTFARDYNVADYSEGRVDYFNHVTYLSRMEELSFLAINRASAVAIEDLFVRMKGQQGEFYKPTWLNDLPPVEISAAGTSSLIQLGTDLANQFANDTVFRAIYVQYKDGTFGCYTVASISVTGNNSLVNLGSPLTVAIDPATVSFISWMPVHRFATDTLTTEWLTDSVAQIKLTLMSLEDLAAEAIYEL